jgi:DNA-binding transcriptional LysR family regulator
MNIRALKSLVAVADHGGFAAAAAAVHLSQSALSVQIKQLEERLGRRLFNREYRPPTLNDYGRAVVGHARSILLLHREIYQLTSGSETPHETLRVGLIPSWALGVMPTTLAALRQIRSLVTIEIVYAPAPDLHAKLGRGEIDVAIVPMPSRQQTHLRWHRLMHEPFMLITSTWHGGEPWQEVRTTVAVAGVADAPQTALAAPASLPNPGPVPSEHDSR